MVAECERLEIPHIFQGYCTCHSFRQADLWKKQGKWGKESPSLELTFLQPILSTQLTLVRNAWGNSTSLQASTGPAKPEHRDFPLQDPQKIWSFNSSSLFSPLFPPRPCPSLLYKRDDYSSLIFFTTTFHYHTKLPNSEGGPLSHPRKGKKNPDIWYILHPFETSYFTEICYFQPTHSYCSFRTQPAFLLQNNT